MVAAMRTSSPLPGAQLREPREGAVVATVIQAYKFALDPTPRQRRALASHCGAARFAYNWGLELVKSRLDQRRGGDNVGVPWTLPELRREWNRAKQRVAPWWAENSKEAYSSGLDGLARALKNWADSRSGQHRGRRPMGFPRWKRKRCTRDTCRFTTGAIHVLSDRKHIQLPRLGILKTHESTRKLTRRLEQGTARVLAATISRTADRWYVSFTVEVERSIPVSDCKPTVVGADVGVNHLAVLSTGERVPNPRALESVQRSRRRLHRRWSRQERTRKAKCHMWPSRRQLRTHRQLARLEARAANIRRNGLHQLTTRLVRNHGAIVVEQLNVIGMLSNRRLARVVADAGFGEIRRLLRYKAVWYGATLVVADLFYPSSKTCSGCGAVKVKLSLAQRSFRCEGCGAVLDRDLNAARNLAKLVVDVAGSGPETENARRVDISPGLAGLTAVKREAGTGRGPGETGTVDA
jgi:putative transposase